MIIIAGPCQHESFEHAMKIASHCQDICDHFGVEYYYKSSYDKANRSHVDSVRGVGLEQTMKDFRRMKNLENIPQLKILTDVHTVEEIDIIESKYADAVDVLQIPAFLCRQTDLLLRAKNSPFKVNVKKGQFIAPWDVDGILSKTGDEDVWITERGTSFGYNNLVVDFTGIQYMTKKYYVPIIFDATHSVQKPGGLGKSSGGNRDYVPGLIRAASAMGIDGIFMEVHDDPNNAPSDGPNSLYLTDFKYIVDEIMEYNHWKV